jgi:hypothetical protein
VNQASAKECIAVKSVCGSSDTVGGGGRARSTAISICIAIVTLAGCSSWEEAATGPATRTSESDRRRAAAGIEGSVMDIFGRQQIGNVSTSGARNDALAASVNRHLWQASLDTLSFMPIASTDPFTGVISTDWVSTPEAPDERVKVTAYVTDTFLAPESLRVAVFREAQGGDGRWVTAPVAAETPRRIEDAILVRARQIRIEEEEAG